MMSMAGKLKAGFFSFTGDEGCMVTVLEAISSHFAEWSGKLDIAFWKVLRSRDWIDEDMDVAIVEGAISSYEEEERLKHLREHCKVLVAVGSCAITGAPSNHRNFFDERRLGEIADFLHRFDYREKVQPLKDFVKVDYEVQGCPVDEAGFVKLMEKLLSGGA